MVATPFLGSAYESRSGNLADCRCINIYAEAVETKEAGKAVGAFYGTPGLVSLATVGSGPIRAMHVMQRAAGEVLFVVSGDRLYAVHFDFTVHEIGRLVIETTGCAYLWDGSAWDSSAYSTITLPFDASIGPDEIFIQMIDNGQQLAVFVNIAATYLDGFGLIAQPNTSLLFQSDLLDLSSWPALNFADASTDPDIIVALQQNRRLIYVIKQRETEIWSNAAAAASDATGVSFVFERMATYYIQQGTQCAASVARVGEVVLWLARSPDGQSMVVMTKDFTTTRVSTHAIETAIASYPTTADAVAYSYHQEGHLFYVISFPSGDATWVYDYVESAAMQQPMWHQRCGFDPASGQFHRHRSNCHALFQDRNIVGDYSNGSLYSFDLDALTDAGVQRKWLRSWRALAKPMADPARYNALRIDMQTGIGLAPDADPLCMLRWSDDGGNVWSNEKFAHVGKIGETARRVIFRRMGSTRRNSGLDRIYELSSIDQFPVALIGAELD